MLTLSCIKSSCPGPSNDVPSYLEEKLKFLQGLIMLLRTWCLVPIWSHLLLPLLSPPAILSLNVSSSWDRHPSPAPLPPLLLQILLTITSWWGLPRPPCLNAQFPLWVFRASNLCSLLYLLPSALIAHNLYITHILSFLVHFPIKI